MWMRPSKMLKLCLLPEVTYWLGLGVSPKCSHQQLMVYPIRFSCSPLPQASLALPAWVVWWVIRTSWCCIYYFFNLINPKRKLFCQKSRINYVKHDLRVCDKRSSFKHVMTKVTNCPGLHKLWQCAFIKELNIVINDMMYTFCAKSESPHSQLLIHVSKALIVEQ